MCMKKTETVSTMTGLDGVKFEAYYDLCDDEILKLMSI